MLAVVDTDHFSALQRDAAFARQFESRRSARGLEVFISAVSVQEVARGWLALLSQASTPQLMVAAYSRFQRGMEALRSWDMLPFDEDAAQLFSALRRQFRQAGTMDLRIAAICLAHDALLLTRNVHDFAFIPGLRVENWLD